MRKVMMLIGMSLMLTFASAAVSAQTKVNVRFPKGETTAEYNGSIRGERYSDYVMRARGGQMLTVVLTEKSGAPVYFNVLPSGSSVAIADDARQASSWKGVLPKSGTFVVRVYMEKADRLARRSASFSLRVGITAE